MTIHSSSHSVTLADAFEQFLEVSSFARRTCESYAEDLAPLIASVGQKPVTELSADVLQTFLAEGGPGYVQNSIRSFSVHSFVLSLFTPSVKSEHSNQSARENSLN